MKNLSPGPTLSPLDFSHTARLAATRRAEPPPGATAHATPTSAAHAPLCPDRVTHAVNAASPRRAAHTVAPITSQTSAVVAPTIRNVPKRCGFGCFVVLCFVFRIRFWTRRLRCWLCLSACPRPPMAAIWAIFYFLHSFWRAQRPSTIDSVQLPSMASIVNNPY